MKAEKRRAVPMKLQRVEKPVSPEDKALWRSMLVPERRTFILAQLQSGTTQTELANRFGVSLSNISLRGLEAYREAGLEKSQPYLFRQSRASSERFWDFVIPEPNSGCWLFVGSDNGHGYGTYGNHGGKGRRYAHRLAYEELVGPIPDGLELDHACNTRCCCNPDHLEPVTRVVNHQRAILRGAVFDSNSQKTHCPSGHLLSGHNLLIKTRSDGRTYRACRTCERAAHRLYRSKKRGAHV